MWSKLETHAPEAYRVISNMRFSQQQYEELLRIYIGKNPNFFKFSGTLRRGSMLVGARQYGSLGAMDAAYTV